MSFGLKRYFITFYVTNIDYLNVLTQILLSGRRKFAGRWQSDPKPHAYDESEVFSSHYKIMS